MARFSDGWEKDFKSRWSLETAGGTGSGSFGSSPVNEAIACVTCKGTTRVVCYQCDGFGREELEESTRQCCICLGKGYVGCGYCRGSGLRILQL